MTGKEYFNEWQSNHLEPTELNLKIAVAYLAVRIKKLKHLKVSFDTNIKTYNDFEGFTTVRKIYLFRFIPVRTLFDIRINPINENWLYVLIHELTHVLIFKKYGLHKHSKRFKAVNRKLLHIFYTAIYNECTKNFHFATINESTSN